jgi:hypothetical protein
MVLSLRLGIVLIAYGLSGVGLFLVLLGFMFSGGLGVAIYFVLVAAWLASLWALHRMAMAWARGVRLGKRFSRLALALGFAGFLAVPVMMIIFHRQPGVVSDAASLALVELTLMSPAIALAVYLNWYHAAEKHPA